MQITQGTVNLSSSVDNVSILYTNEKLNARNLKLLGSGSYTTVTNGVWEDAGNFTTPSSLDKGTLFIEIISTQDSGASNQTLSLHNASGNATTAEFSTANNTDIDYSVKLKIWPTSTTNSSYVKKDLTTLSFGLTSAFILNATEQIFIKIKSNAAGNVFKLNWNAYIINDSD